MGIQVNIHEAKSTLSSLIERAVSGEDVTIAKAGEPKVKLVPVGSETTSETPGKRTLGWARGRFVAPDDIKTSFTDEIERQFGHPPTGESDLAK